MITFKSIAYKNFLSTGGTATKILLSKSPTTLIHGHSGSGKSTILDAIMFGLFNKPFRNINKPNLINSINLSECLVEIEFAIGKKDYKIRRGMKPTTFEIFENGVMINQDAAARDYQKYLEDHILGGLNDRIFKQVVILGSADYRPFMQLPASQRREVVEELLDIRIFSQMLELAKVKINNYKDSLKNFDYDISLKEEKINLHKQNQTDLKKQVADKKIELEKSISWENAKIAVADAEILETTAKKTDLYSKLTNHQHTKASVADMNNLLIGLRTHRTTAFNTLKFFNENASCSQCSQNIPHEHKEAILALNTEKHEALVKGIVKLELELAKKQEMLKTFDKIEKVIIKMDRDIYQLQSDISSHQKYITKLQKEMSGLSENKAQENFQTVLTEMENDLLTVKTDRVNMMEEKQYYEIVSEMLKDGGIKTKIIKQYLPVMNKIVNSYLEKMGLPVDFTFDEQFNEVLKSRHRDSFLYANFSEGEKSRIDLSILLAWRHLGMAKNTINTNMLILDEVMDGHLDAQGREDLLNILLELSNKTNIFVISHVSAGELYDKFRSAIHFEKQGNFSRIT